MSFAQLEAAARKQIESQQVENMAIEKSNESPEPKKGKTPKKKAIKPVQNQHDDEMQNYLLEIRDKQSVLLKQFNEDEMKAQEVVLAEERRQAAELAEAQARQEALERAAKETPE